LCEIGVIVFQLRAVIESPAVAHGATPIVVAPEGELGSLPNRATRRIAPTILLDVPDDARISREEIFGPVLPIYVYDDPQEVIDYVASRPTPLGAYWYGEDDAEFHGFLDHTNSRGVTRNDGITHALLLDAPFGGAGNSGSGSYHSKDGFDTFTHRRTVSNVTAERGVSDGLIGRALDDEQFHSIINQAISDSANAFRAHLK
jgi:coniferyl-aldehyde dehydrogenase